MDVTWREMLLAVSTTLLSHPALPIVPSPASRIQMEIGKFNRVSLNVILIVEEWATALACRGVIVMIVVALTGLVKHLKSIVG